MVLTNSCVSVLINWWLHLKNHERFRMKTGDVQAYWRLWPLLCSLTCPLVLTGDRIM